MPWLRYWETRCAALATSFLKGNPATISQSRGEARRDNVTTCDRRTLEFPLSIAPREVAKMLKAEGWYGPKTTVYHVEFRVRRLREKA